MEPDNSIDYVAVLADLEAQRAALDSAINGLRQWLRLGIDVAQVRSAGASGAPPRGEVVTVESDTFFNMSIPEAAIKYLRMMRKPQSVSDICDALLRGGMHSDAKDFRLIAYGILARRANEKGDIKKVKRGCYGLTEWYTNKRSGETD